MCETQAASQRLDGMSHTLGALLGDPDRGAHAALNALNGTVLRQSLILAFNDAFAVAAGIAMVLLVVVITMRKPTVTPSGVASH